MFILLGMLIDIERDVMCFSNCTDRSSDRHYAGYCVGDVIQFNSWFVLQRP